jgi:hypothetical protein
MDITAGEDFLGFVITKVHMNICTILDGYGVMAAWNLEWRIKNIKINGTIRQL